jgi:hypothetical protein
MRRIMILITVILVMACTTYKPVGDYNALGPPLDPWDGMGPAGAADAAYDKPAEEKQKDVDRHDRAKTNNAVLETIGTIGSGIITGIGSGWW